MTDIAIHDAIVLTVDNQNRLFERGTVVVDDGRITAVRSSNAEDELVDADSVIDGGGMVVMPGLVNAHTHLEMTALIGAFSDLDLLEMMSSGIALFSRLAFQSVKDRLRLQVCFHVLYSCSVFGNMLPTSVTSIAEVLYRNG